MMQRLMRWEPTALWFLFVVLAIISFSTAVSAQQAAKAAKASDLIAQCTKPGTRCYTLQVQAEARRTAQNKCVINTIIIFPPSSERASKRAEILKAYDDCVEELSRVTTTTTTTLLPN